MTAYTKSTDFAIKDSLLSGNPSKVVRGSEINTEFVAIQAADADNVKISGLATGVATFLATPSSANLAAVLTDETGSGAAVFATSPTLVTPALGTPSSGVLTNATGLPISSGVAGLGTGVATALTVNVGTAGAPVVNGGALGTPSSGTVTNLTGTASININGTVGATTPAAGTFTTLTTTGNATIGDAEASDTHAIKGATMLLANSASATLTVTQTGSGNAFVVEDSTSPDSTPFVIDTDGRVISGNTSVIQIANPVSGAALFPNVQVIGTSAVGTFSVVRVDSSASTCAIALSKARGSIGALSSVASGDGVGRISFQGHDGTNALSAAFITAEVDGTPGTNDMPGRLVFSTTADGASSPIERVRIDSAGKVTGSASYVAHSATAIPAGGTEGAGVMVSSTANFGVFFGSGVPTLSAAQGSLYLRSDGSSTSTRMYVNTNGSTTWTAVTTAA